MVRKQHKPAMLRLRRTIKHGQDMLQASRDGSREGQENGSTRSWSMLGLKVGYRCVCGCGGVCVREGGAGSSSSAVNQTEMETNWGAWKVKHIKNVTAMKMQSTCFTLYFFPCHDRVMSRASKRRKINRTKQIKINYFKDILYVQTGCLVKGDQGITTKKRS